MSNEEQDQILGRLTRESKESRKRLVALNAKMLLFKKNLVDTAATFKGFLEPSGAGPHGNISQAKSVVSLIPLREEILSTLEELEKQLEYLNTVEAQLRQFD
jgi:hypothetical protein